MFVGALNEGSTLGAAARQAMKAAGEFDLATHLQLIFQIGAVAAVNLPEQ